MKKLTTTIAHKQFPVLIQRGVDDWYVATMPLFTGCYAQGKTLDDALKNIREAIALCLEEKENESIARTYNPSDIGLHAVTLAY